MCCGGGKSTVNHGYCSQWNVYEPTSILSSRSVEPTDLTETLKCQLLPKFTLLET